MSLSFWFRDYVFIPLGGSHRGLSTTFRNLLIVWLLVGLWHGAAWTFVVWGLLHGAYLVVHALARRGGLTPSWTWLNRIITFVAVVVAWVFFRAPTLGVAADVLSAMAGGHGLSPIDASARVPLALLAMVAAGLLWVNVAPNSWEVDMRPRLSWALAFGLVLGAAILTIAQPSPFLYFQF